MSQLGFYSYASAAVAFLVLSLLLVTSWRGRMQGALLAAATVVTCLWAVISSLYTAAASPGALLPQIFELLKYGAWYLFLFRLLRAGKAREFRVLLQLLAGLGLALTAVYLYSLAVGRIPAFVQEARLIVLADALLAVAGLVLVEQLYRNTPGEQRWSIKYLCFGIGGMFAYDFYLYADILLFGHITPWVWNARGLVYTLVVPLIAVSAARNPQWSLDVFVSRRIVFHGAALLATGIYLLIMAAGGFYIRYYGGDWGGVAQAVFVFGALMLLLVILSSGHARAYLRVFLNKHFFNYKYDYRDEWLGFIRKLTSASGEGRWRERAIKALADIVDSPGGVLWERGARDGYEIMAHFAMPESGLCRIDATGPLATFLQERQWVINLVEYRQDPGRYPGLILPEWLIEREDAWLIVPLMLDNALEGVILLAKPLAPRDYSWEDNDILKTAGTQVAGYLIQQRATQELINARQFEATNRMAAFMMHDLKNVMAQLSLLLDNAEKHKRNPVFVDDMIATVDNVMRRMERMLARLGGGQGQQDRSATVDMVSLLEETRAIVAAGRPHPEVYYEARGLSVQADADRLSAVLAHIVRNAQDATPEDGRVVIRLKREDEQAVVEVDDTGRGMDQQFIRERLFRPFDTTKGSSGMGIGAYECREYVRELGGEVEVESEPGKGTRFRIMLPVAAVPQEKAAI